jgi:hypothetical protein
MRLAAAGTDPRSQRSHHSIVKSVSQKIAVKLAAFTYQGAGLVF